MSAYVPYCSSDVYTGTRNASAGTGNLIFHGKYIVKAIIQDLIDNTWVTEAEEVVLMGSSAGAIGTESNCDMLADELHRYNSDIKVKCISDSGTIYPFDTHSPGCFPHLLQYSFFQSWDGISDESCLEENPDGYDCISATTAYPYITTPILLLHSSTDTTIRYCYEDTEEFWQRWKQELADIGTTIAAYHPEGFGIFLVNCPFHGAVGHSYTNMEVPLLDSSNPGETILLRDLIDNFMKEKHPYQAIDDMSVTKNPNCKR